MRRASNRASSTTTFPLSPHLCLWLPVPCSPLLSWSRRAKQAFALLADVLAALVAVWLAFYLRIEQVGMPVQQQLNAYAAALLFVPVFIRLGLYRAVFGMPVCGR